MNHGLKKHVKLFIIGSCQEKNILGQFEHQFYSIIKADISLL